MKIVIRVGDELADCDPFHTLKPVAVPGLGAADFLAGVAGAGRQTILCRVRPGMVADMTDTIARAIGARAGLADLRTACLPLSEAEVDRLEAAGARPAGRRPAARDD